MQSGRAFRSYSSLRCGVNAAIPNAGLGCYLWSVKHLATLIWLFLLAGNSLAQVNLVPNGSFEEFDTCPPMATCASGNLELALGWYEPIVCSSDFRHTCGWPDGCGIEPGIPADGGGIAGMAVYGGGFDTREYAAIKLTEPLITDSVYLFSIQLRLPTNTQARIGSFGAYFSADSATDYSNHQSLIDIEPQLQRNPDSILTNPATWYLWKDTLIASGDEQFLVLGNFLSDNNTPFIQPTWISGGGYMIDDVQLTPITVPKPNSVRELSLEINLTVKLVSEQLEIITDQAVQLNLMDISGRTVLSGQLNSGQSSVNVSSFPDGMYVAVFTSENGQTTSRKILKAN